MKPIACTDESLTSISCFFDRSLCGHLTNDDEMSDEWVQNKFGNRNNRWWRVCKHLLESMFVRAGMSLKCCRQHCLTSGSGLRRFRGDFCDLIWTSHLVLLASWWQGHDVNSYPKHQMRPFGCKITEQWQGLSAQRGTACDHHQDKPCLVWLSSENAFIKTQLTTLTRLGMLCNQSQDFTVEEEMTVCPSSVLPAIKTQIFRRD